MLSSERADHSWSFAIRTSGGRDALSRSAMLSRNWKVRGGRAFQSPATCPAAGRAVGLHDSCAIPLRRQLIDMLIHGSRAPSADALKRGSGATRWMLGCHAACITAWGSEALRSPAVWQADPRKLWPVHNKPEMAAGSTAPGPLTHPPLLQPLTPEMAGGASRPDSRSDRGLIIVLQCGRTMRGSSSTLW